MKKFMLCSCIVVFVIVLTVYIGYLSVKKGVECKLSFIENTDQQQVILENIQFHDFEFLTSAIMIVFSSDCFLYTKSTGEKVKTKRKIYIRKYMFRDEEKQDLFFSYFSKGGRLTGKQGIFISVLIANKLYPD